MRTNDLGRGDYGVNGNQNPSANPFEIPGEEGENTEAADTTKKKERKPLESYFFDDSTRMRDNFAWQVDMHGNNIRMIDIDTLLTDFQIDFPFLKQDVGDAYLGNLGGASIPLNFFRRPQNRDFTLSSPFYAYIFTPDNAPFYNVKKPFTQAGYLTAGQKKYAEENFSLIHAQNASPSTGFNLTYHNRGTRGIYDWQGSKAKALSLAFSHTGKRYSAHAGYIFNHINLKENGGVIDDWHITDTTYEIDMNIPMSMSDARNVIKNNTFYAIQAYGVPLVKLTDEDFSMAGYPSFYVGHAIEYSRWFRSYTDTYAQGAGEYYENWYINTSETADSTFESRLSNRLFIQLQPWDRDGIIGVIDAGVGLDNYHYYQFRLDDYLAGKTKGENKTSFNIYGSIDGKFKKYFDWGGKLNFTPIGYRSGDLSIEANAALSVYLKDKPVSLSGSFVYRRNSPNYWSETYFSNHFAWSNSFNKENESRIDVKLQVPSIHLDLSACQSVMTNRIYFNERALPAQESNAVSVSGLYASKEFRLGGFHLNPRVMLQWSTDHRVAPVPLASTFLSCSFQFYVVKDVLLLKFGVDGRYNTRYYAPGYNPALAQFYNQREKEIGNYVWMDAFITAKWKRMRIFLKFQHVNQDLFDTREYFQTLHYPLNARIFKYGISWSFYD